MALISCPNCGNQVSSAALACPKCKKQLTQLQHKMASPTYVEQSLRGASNLVEYRRTCQVCEKVWHSLVSREEQIISIQKTDALMAVSGGLQSCGTCGTMGTETQAQARGNLNAHESELQRLRSCPQCSSANYREEIIDHAN